MLTPFEVYLVLQLDEVRAASQFVFFITIVSALGLLALVGAADFDEEARARAKRPAMAIGAVFSMAFLVCTFVPATRTAAAMIVLPALTSNQVMDPATAELREFLDLAKDALRAATAKDQPEPTK